MKVVEQFKKRILDLTIRGKLVPQDPSDEPASVLVERIYAEREKAGKGKKGKRKNLPSHAELGDLQSHAEPQGRGEGCLLHTEAQRHGGVSDSRLNLAGGSRSCATAAPFPIPDSWEWVRLGEVSNYGQCTSVDTIDIDSGTWSLDLEDIEKGTGRLIERKTIAEKPSKSSKHVFAKGTLLYSKLRTYLNKVLVADMDGVCTSEIIPVELHGGISAEYVRAVLMSPYFLEYTESRGYGVKMPRIGTNDMRTAIIPLPPLAEQKRIAAKVEELFKVADALGEAADGLEATAQRLERKILDLAIRGRLVPQDPADEPATELLKRVAAERQALIKAGKLKVGKAAAALFPTSDRPAYATCDERPPHAEERGGVSDPRLDLAGGSRSCATAAPFPIPDSWEWVRLGEVLLPMTSKRPTGEMFDYIDIDAIDNRRNVVRAAKRLPVEGATSRAAREVRTGDIVFSMVRPYLRNIAPIDDDHAHCIASMGFYVCRPTVALHSAFLYHLLLSDYVTMGLNALMKGDNSPGVTTGDVATFSIPLPPLAEQKRIAAKVEEMAALQNTLKRLFQQ